MATASSRQVKTFTDAPSSNLQDKWGHQCEYMTSIDPSRQGERRFEAMAAERFRRKGPVMVRQLDYLHFHFTGKTIRAS
jgi:hypothetical protein